MSSNPTALMNADLPLPVFRRGKVRDVYNLGDKLLIVSTDRISAFDVVLPCGIPGKGEVLTRLAAFWFEKTSHIVPNHMVKVVESSDLEVQPKDSTNQPTIAGVRAQEDICNVLKARTLLEILESLRRGIDGILKDC